MKLKKETEMKSYRGKTRSKQQRMPLDLADMRSWRGKRSISRALVLVTWLDGLFDPGSLLPWLESPNPRLDGAAPIDLLEAGKWKVFADLIDDMFTGAPM